MLNPKDEFEKDRIKFKSNLNFKYIWKYRTDNKLARDSSFNEYKDKLGHYIDIYNSDYPLEDTYIKIYPVYEKILKILQKLNVRVSNKIKTTNEQLAIAVFTMTSQQLEQFALSIMNNAEAILLMVDNEFDVYIQSLIQQIKSGLS